MALVYRELRRRAAAHLRRERAGHTSAADRARARGVRPTRQSADASWQNRAQFLAVISQMMRRILVDHARARLAAKRSGRWPRVTLGRPTMSLDAVESVDRLDLDARSIGSPPSMPARVALPN